MFRVTQRPLPSHMPVIARRICFLDVTQARDETPDRSCDTGMNPPLEVMRQVRLDPPTLDRSLGLAPRPHRRQRAGRAQVERALQFFSAVLQARGGAASNPLTPIFPKIFPLLQLLLHLSADDSFPQNLHFPSRRRCSYFPVSV